MKLQYLGTAAAEGIPALFCKCDTCTEARKRGGRNVRTRPQAIVDGKLLLDFNADTYMHVLQNGIDLADVHHCLITHTHSDHFYPEDIGMRRPGFSSLGTSEEERFNIYGSYGAMLKLRGYLSSKSFDTDYYSLNPLKPYVQNKVGDYTVIPLESIHDTHASPFFYLIKGPDGKTLLYAHDTHYFSEKVWEYLEKEKPRIDFASLDCTSAATPLMTYIGHMNLNDNKKAKNKLIKIGCADEKTVFCCNHFSHNGESVLYEEFSVLAKEKGFITSYDGMTVEF